MTLRRWLGNWTIRGRKSRNRVRLPLAVEALEQRWVPSVFSVTNTADSGAGSLRQAILDANSNPGKDTIQFSIGTGNQTISPASALPTITDPVILDGTSQPGYAGSPLIQVRGASAGSGVSGLTITGGGSTVQGLWVDHWNGDGIDLKGSNGDSVQSTWISGNGGDGLRVTSGANGIAGSAISGNGSAGVVLSGTGATGNTLSGNLIGLNGFGTAALGNAGDGVLIASGASSNTIGGTSAAARNVISGNGQASTLTSGVFITGSGTSANLVEGDYIGTDINGTAAMGNGFEGVTIVGGASGNTIGGSTPGAGNLISGNGQGGVNNGGVGLGNSGTTGNIVAGNYIGTDVSGSVALANQGDGIVIVGKASGNTIGGSAAAAGNVISANSGDGIEVSAAGTNGNTIQENLIGLNAAGSAALGNARHGIEIINGAGGNTVGAGNVISGNQLSGIYVNGPTTSNNVIQGNMIGTNPAGTAVFGNGSLGQETLDNQGIKVEDAANDTIGGPASGNGNIISGNSGNGILLAAGSTGILIQGNYIGTNASSAANLGNGVDGIRSDSSSGNTLGGTAPGAGNVISGNGGNGITLLAHAGSTQPFTPGSNDPGGLTLTSAGVAAGFKLSTFIDHIPTAPSTNNTIGPFGMVFPPSGGFLTSLAVGAVYQFAQDKDNQAAPTASKITSYGYVTIAMAIADGQVYLAKGGPEHIIRLNPDGTPGATVVSSLPGGQGVREMVANPINGHLLANTGAGGQIYDIDPTTSPATVTLFATGLQNPDGMTITPDGSTLYVADSGQVIAYDVPSRTLKSTFPATPVTTLDGITLGTGALAGYLFANTNDGRIVELNAADPSIQQVIASGGSRGDFAKVDTTNGTMLFTQTDRIERLTIPAAGIAANNVIQGNIIGTNGAGTVGVGNATDGIDVLGGAYNNTIGGTAAGAGNVIWGNAGNGVYVSDTGTSSNAILGNSIGGNGIVLGTGGNDNQAAPVLTFASNASGTTSVSGSLSGAANTSYIVQFFASGSDTPSQGQTYLGQATVTTDAGGNASFTVSLGVRVSTTQYVTATATSLASNDTSGFSAAVTLPDHLVFLGQPGDTQAGSAISPAVSVQVYDHFGTLLTNDNSDTVTLKVASGPGDFAPGSTILVTVSGGVATFSNLLLDTAGTGYTLTASMSGVPDVASSSFAVTAGPANHLAFLVAPGSTPAGSAINPAVQVEVVDLYGNLVSSDNTDSVTLSVASGPGGFTSGSTTTATVSGGIATFDNLVLDTAGTYTLGASSGSLTAPTSGSFPITPLKPDHLGFTGALGSYVAGTAINPPVVVQLFDPFDNLASNDNSDQVTLTIASGPAGGTFTSGSTRTVTVSGGVATFGNLVLDVAGAYTFAASGSGGQSGPNSSAATILPAAPDHLLFIDQPTDTPAGSPINPAVTVQLYDRFGNFVSTDNTDGVTIQVASGPGRFTPLSTKTVVVSGGVGTFSNLVLTVAGTYTLSASGPGTVTGPASTRFTVAPGTPAQLAFDPEPANATAGSAFSATVQVQDQYGNAVDGDNGDQVTLSVASGPGNATFTGDSTITATVSNGVATFSPLILDTAGQYTLGATGILTAPLSNPFTMSPAAADHLEFQGTPSNVAAGQTLTGVKVAIFDRFENLLTTDFTDQVSVAIATGPGSFTTGSTTTATVSGGVVSFENLLTLTRTGQYTLSATATGNLKGPSSSAFQVSPGVANQLVFSVEPADTTAGVAINSTGTAVTVQILDPYGNLLTQDNNDQVSLGASGPGGFTAGSKATRTVSGGVAVFNNLVLNTAGAYTLGVSSGSITGLASSSFHVNPAAADHLSPPIQQPTGRVTAGALLEVQLAVEDQFNNVVTSDNSTVSVALAGNPSGVTLGGTLGQQAVAGIATFNDLTISGAGTFSIQASDSNPAVASTTTNPFEVDQLKLSSTSVLEFRPDGALVGSLGVQGGSGHTYHYALIMGASSPDAKSFSLSGNQLLTTDAFNLAAKSSYSVKLRATDETGHTVDQVFTITVQADPHLKWSGKTLTVNGTKGNDTFSFAPGGVQDSLTLNGLKLAVDTANVNAIVFQGGGGSDSATLSGSSGPDTLSLSATGGTLAGKGYTLTLEGVGFVTATGGVGDVAKLTGSAGSDTFTGSKGNSTLAGKGFSDTVLNFPTVYVNGGKGTDKAVLSVSTSGNAFVGNKGTATLGGSGYSIVLTAVEDVTLNGKAGGKNTIHLAQVSYKLHQNGVWVKV